MNGHQVVFRFRLFGPSLIFQKIGNGNHRQNADNGHDDHQLRQTEPSPIANGMNHTFPHSTGDPGMTGSAYWLT